MFASSRYSSVVISLSYVAASWLVDMWEKDLVENTLIIFLNEVFLPHVEHSPAVNAFPSQELEIICEVVPVCASVAPSVFRRRRMEVVSGPSREGLWIAVVITSTSHCLLNYQW